ncbi:MAG TPA: hypothetical protein VFX96_09005, partial [Pyrinomonadaceae bacterium]|nr:hypothetical protein [Pyrinomonadaceae bacterium]
MNCQNFETLAAELARGALVETSARDDARAHAEACRTCAARLADERALAAGLRAFAESERDLQAPARVEAALLAAFRAHVKDGATRDADALDTTTRHAFTRDASTNPRASEVGARATARSLRWFPRWAQGAAVAAASALLVFGLYGLFVKRAGVV